MRKDRSPEMKFYIKTNLVLEIINGISKQLNTHLTSQA
jgi:hypothetical protein